MNKCLLFSHGSDAFKKFYSSFYSTIVANIPVEATNDYVFKGIFGDTKRTQNFIESILIGKDKILPIGTKIKDLTYLRNEYIQKIHPENAKKILFDLQIDEQRNIYY